MTSPPIVTGDCQPAVESGFKTYGFAFAILFPVIFLFIFSNLIIIPKLERIWTDAGFESSSAWWLMRIVRTVFENGKVVMGTVVAALIVLEKFARGWPAKRRAVVLCVTVVINTAMLVGLTFATVSVLLAAPVLAAKARKEASAHQEP